MLAFDSACNGCRHRTAASCIVFVLVSCIVPAAEPSEQQPRKSTYSVRKSSGPYCGLYCLYATMKLAGTEVNFADLVKPEYIASRKGSSLAELKKAAENHSLYAEPVAKLSNEVLRHSQYQVILHVKSSLEDKQYNHYELFLGTLHGKARIFDPPNSIRLVPFHQLARRWDGSGLIVSAEPIDLGAVFAPARKRTAMYATVGVTIILIFHCIKRRWFSSAVMKTRNMLLWLSVAQAAGLAIAAVLAGFVYHFANDEGFLARANDTEFVQPAHIVNSDSEAQRKASKPIAR